MVRPIGYGYSHGYGTVSTSLRSLGRQVAAVLERKDAKQD